MCKLNLFSVRRDYLISIINMRRIKNTKMGVLQLTLYKRRLNKIYYK